MKKICFTLLTALLVFFNCSTMAIYALEDIDAILPEESESHQGIVSLEDKTVMIVGNSMVYYGNCVIKGSAGKEDYGYFYQLAAANDENVTVIDHTYSGKKLDYIYENYLVKLSEEERNKVDYLVLSEGNQVNEDLVGTCEKILALFPEDVEFRFLRQPMMFESNMPCLIEGVEELRENGYIVVDWGKLVYDIYSGATQVPGATMEFNRCSFMKENLGYINGPGTVISVNNSGDRNHQNILSGYITAQMLYTSITNRSALYTDYSFCYDTTIHPYFDIDGFAEVHYTGPAKTNFHEIFRSPQDIVGLQQLMDTYLRAEGMHPLVVQPAVKPTCATGGLTEGSYCVLCDQIIDQQQLVPVDTTAAHQMTFLKGTMATCTENGKTAGAYCELCGHTMMYQNIISPLGHSPEQQLIEATLNEDGAVQQVCTTCGMLLESQSIPKIVDVTLSETNYIYNGLEQNPTVTVKDSKGKTLKKDIDYMVSYSSGRNTPGKYTVKVTFKGKYEGVKRTYFTIVPAKPKLTATQTIKTITLKWEKVAGASGYRVYKYNSKTKKYEHIASVTKGTSYKLSNLKSGTIYKFKVRAYKNGDEVLWGDYSSVFETATRTTTPKITKISSTAKGKVNLTWSNVSGESGYQVYYSTKKSSGYKKVTSYKTNVLSGSKSKLTSKKTYYFKVRAYKKTDSGTVYSSYSEVKSIKVK